MPLPELDYERLYRDFGLEPDVDVAGAQKAPEDIVLEAPPLFSSPEPAPSIEDEQPPLPLPPAVKPPAAEGLDLSFEDDYTSQAYSDLGLDWGLFKDTLSEMWNSDKMQAAREGIGMATGFLLGTGTNFGENPPDAGQVVTTPVIDIYEHSERVRKFAKDYAEGKVEKMWLPPGIRDIDLGKHYGKGIKVDLSARLADIAKDLEAEGKQEDADVFWKLSDNEMMRGELLGAHTPEKIETLGDAIDWLAGGLAEMGGTMTPSMIVSILSARGAEALPATAPKAIKTLMQYAPNALMSIQVERGLATRNTREATGKANKQLDDAFGTVAGLLDAIGLGKFGGKFTKESLEHAIDMATNRRVKDILRRAGETYLGVAAAEGFPEFMQNFLEKAPAKILTDESYTKADLNEAIQEGLLATLGLGFFSSAASVTSDVVSPGGKLASHVKEGIGKFRERAKRAQLEGRQIARPGEEPVGKATLGELAPELLEIRKKLEESKPKGTIYGGKEGVQKGEMSPVLTEEQMREGLLGKFRSQLGAASIDDIVNWKEGKVHPKVYADIAAGDLPGMLLGQPETKVGKLVQKAKDVLRREMEPIGKEEAPPPATEQGGGDVEKMTGIYAKALMKEFGYSEEEATNIADLANRTLPGAEGIEVGKPPEGTEGRTLRQEEGTPEVKWYSRMVKRMEEYPQSEVPPSQILGWLKKNVAPEELEWAGSLNEETITDYVESLKGRKKVPVSEVVDWIKRNSLVVEEHEFGERRMQYAHKRIAGGTNVRALVISSPFASPYKESVGHWGGVGEHPMHRINRLPEGKARNGAIKEVIDLFFGETEAGKQVLNNINALSSKDQAVAREQVFKRMIEKVPEGGKAIGFLRLSDRVGPKGEKILMIDNLQSPRHQEAAKIGKYHKFGKEGFAKYLNEVFPEEVAGEILSKPDSGTYKRLYNQYTKTISGVFTMGIPDAPWKGTRWVELLFRAAMKKAVEGGYQKIAWTTGAQQKGIWGEEGLKDIYDKIIPKAVKNIIKGLGGEIGSTTIEREGRDLQVKTSTDHVLGTVEFNVYDKDTGKKVEGPFSYRDAALGFIEEEQMRGTTGVPAEQVKLGVHSIDITPAIVNEFKTIGVQLMQGTRGATTFTGDEKTFIYALKNPDLSTAIHEIGHVARRQLLNRDVPLSQRKGITDEEIEYAEKWFGVKKPGVWSRKSEEKFARTWERYLMEGKAPSTELEALFKKLSEYLFRVYKTITNRLIDYEITPEMRKIFDKMVMDSPALTEEFGEETITRNFASDDPHYGAKEDSVGRTPSERSTGNRYSDRSLENRKHRRTYSLWPRETGLKPLAGPEIIELIRSLTGGKLPKIVRSIIGGAQGLFKTKGTPESAQILIQKDVFKGPHLGTQTFVKGTSEMDIQRWIMKLVVGYAGAEAHDIMEFRREYEDGRTRVQVYLRNEGSAEEVLAHEIGHWVGHVLSSAGSVSRKANILSHIAGFHKYYNDFLSQLPPGMKNPDPPANVKKAWMDKAKNYAKQKGIDPTTKAGKEYVHGLYMMFEDMYSSQHGLFSMNRITKELTELTKMWRPWQEGTNKKYDRYRHSPVELYADAFSVLVNEPDLLYKVAPTFYNAFFNWFSVRPQAQDTYNTMQDLTAAGQLAVDDARQLRQIEADKRGHEARAKNQELRKKVRETAADKFFRHFVTRYWAAVKGRSKLTGDQRKLRDQLTWKLDEIRFVAGEVYDYYKEIQERVMDELEKKFEGFQGKNLPPGADYTYYLGQYMLFTRIKGNRALFGNPGGYNPETAQESLDAMKREIGEDRYKALEEAAKEYRAIREETIIDKMRNAGFASPEMIESMIYETDYAKFNVIDHFDKIFGDGAVNVHGGFFSKQIGTLGSVENVFQATVLHDMSLFRAVAVNNAKVLLMQDLLYHQTIKPAEYKWATEVVGGKKIKKRRIVDPVNAEIMRGEDAHNFKVLTVIVDGKPVHFYAPYTYTDMFTYSPVEAGAFAKLWSGSSVVLKKLFVAWNTVWALRNLPRDFLGTVMRNQEIGFSKIHKLAWYYMEAFREAMKVTVGLDPGGAFGLQPVNMDKTSFMFRSKMLNPERIYSARDLDLDTELMKLGFEFKLSTTAQQKAYEQRSWIRKQLYHVTKGRPWLSLDEWGRFTETWAKLAGFHFLLKETQLSETEMAHRVRSRVGTPNAFSQGDWNHITNSIAMFSNINKEGMRSSFEAAKKDPMQYALKVFVFNILPKMLNIMAGTEIYKFLYRSLGQGGDDEEDAKKSYFGRIKRIMDGVPDYYKAHYTVIPLFLTKDGKSVFITLPEDYEGQIWGALTYYALSKKITGPRGMISELWKIQPYWGDIGIPNHAMIEVMANLYEYYAKNQRPIDEFSGFPVMTEQEYMAQGLPAAKSLAKYAWRSTSGSLGYIFPGAFDRYEIPKEGLEKFLEKPLIGPIVGKSFLRVSDRGIADIIADETIEGKRKRARDSLKVRDQIIDQVNELGAKHVGAAARQLYRKLREDGTISKEVSMREFEGRYRKEVGRSYDQRTITSFMYANTNDEKVDILMTYKELFTKDEYENLYKLLNTQKLISSDVKSKLRRAEREARRGLR